MALHNKTDEEITIALVLVPKASKDEIVGLLGDELKITITAPPIDGKANAHLIAFLSKQFKTAKSNIEILRGETNKHKLVKIKNYKQLPTIVEHLFNV
jgi:uncharacterized protein (TIGR00251 family)